MADRKTKNQKLNKSLTFITAALVIISSAASLQTRIPTQALAPTSLGYQGILRNSGQAPLSGGYDFMVRYYGVQTGGSVLYSESFSGVSVSNGCFFLSLGSGLAVAGTYSGLDFNTPIFVSFDTKLSSIAAFDGEMTPRISMAASPYSNNTQRVQGRGIGGNNGLVTYDGAGNISTINLNASGLLVTGTNNIAITNTLGYINASALQFADSSIQVVSNGLKVKLNPNGALVSDANGVGLRTNCNTGELLKWTGSSWSCGIDNDNQTLSLLGNDLSITNGNTLTLPTNTGPQGPIGIAGAIGATGSQGIQGIAGAIGATGAQGIQGLNGIAGPQGSVGLTGAQGIQGIQGLVGLTGATGPQGIQGLIGATGATGLQGIQGLPGNIGATGLTGTQGLKGDKGDTGLQGIAGLTGANGAQGIQGLQGLTGATGLQGVQGIAGTIGATGLTGPTGSAGTQGIQGLVGAIGLTGLTGAQGPIGLTGAQGIQGDQGIQGLTGLTGPQGATGIQGPIGLTGATGLQGISGPKGDQGIQGVQGLTGAQGIQGIAGVANIQTANNGLTLTGSNLQLGGSLTTPSNITTTAVNTLSITGLQNGSISDKLIVQDINGTLKTLSASLINNGGTLNQAYNFGGPAAGSDIIVEGTNPGVTIRTNGIGVGPNTALLNLAGTNGTMEFDLPNYVGGENRLNFFGSGGGRLSSDYQVTLDANWNKLKVDVLSGLSFKTSIFQNPQFSVANNGQTQLNAYSASRDDTAATTPVNFLYTDASGSLLSAPISTLGGGSSIQTANNGLTLASSNLTLGGSLTKPTIIGTDSTNTLAITNLTAGSLNDLILVQDQNTGDLRNISSSQFTSPIINIRSNLYSTGLPFEDGSDPVENSLFLLYGAGENATNAGQSNFIGFQAGKNAINANGSNFIGFNAGLDASVSRFSNFIGDYSGSFAPNASYSSFLGANSGRGAINANNSLFFGNGSGYYDTVDNSLNGTSILIGDYTNTGGFSNSIAIGKSAVNTSSNQFKIAPSYNNLSIGGVEYVVPNAQATAAGQVLTNNGSGTLSWTAATGSSYTAGNGINISGNTISTSCSNNTGNPFQPETFLCVNGNDGVDNFPLTIGLRNNALSASLRIKSANGINLNISDSDTTSLKQFKINPIFDSFGNNISGSPINDSGLTLSQLSNSTQASTATNYLGFDNSGKVVKVASPTSGGSQTVNNGLTLAGNNLKLGGVLTSPTIISSTAVNTLSITGLQNGLNTDKFLVQDSNGILKTLNSSLIGINSLQSAYDFTGNGAGNTINLFNSKPVSINSTSDFVNFFTTGLELKNFDTSYQTGTNLAIKGAYNTYLIDSSKNLTIRTSSQGLLSLASGSTVIDTGTGTSILDSNTNSSGLFFPRLNNSTPVSTATNYLGYDTNGKVVRVATPTSGGIQTASNGLTLSGSNLQLGGTLTQNTSIDGTSANKYSLSVTNGNLNLDQTNTAGTTGIVNIGGQRFINT
jgi:Collagen triple helix repeat (20 copies)